MISINTKYCALSGNALKIIAAITMLVDHIGFILFPGVTILRILGRISFPIFAFMIAEGCHYTKNKLRYFLGVFILGAICQSVLYIQKGDTKMGVLITFSLSIIIVYALQYMKNVLFAPKKGVFKPIISICIFLLTTVGVYLLSTYVRIDYGFFGCMAPAFASIFKKPSSATSTLWNKLDTNILNTVMLGICIIIIGCIYGRTQPYALLAIPFLLLYSGKRGRLKMKYFFYLFYPIHLVVLEGIRLLF